MKRFSGLAKGLILLAMLGGMNSAWASEEWCGDVLCEDLPPPTQELEAIDDEPPHVCDEDHTADDIF